MVTVSCWRCSICESSVQCWSEVLPSENFTRKLFCGCNLRHVKTYHKRKLFVPDSFIWTRSKMFFPENSPLSNALPFT